MLSHFSAEAIPNPTPDLDTACTAFAAFLEGCSPSERLVALHDSDADGVAAVAVWRLGLERLGFSYLAQTAPDRERNAWTPANRTLVAAREPQHLFVLDLGSQPHPVLDGIPNCFIDHHRPEGVPPDATLVTAYHWNPTPNTSLLLYDLLAPHGDPEGLDWIAAIGTVSDLGERAPFALLEAAKKRYTAKYLKECAALINAIRRTPQYAPDRAVNALLTHDSPRALATSTSPDVEAMRVAREHVKAEMEEARKAAPTFAGPVALIRIRSDSQIHPLIAQAWRTRLPKYLVIVANESYLPGRVNFSARAGGETNVLDFFQSLEMPEGEGHFGHGHDQASGGSLPVARWNELLDRMGFPASVHARLLS